MSSRGPPQPSQNSSFIQQRDALLNQVTAGLEHVLQNINKLNRSLEGVIAVGNEFGAVEALWSQFEGVMAFKEDGNQDTAEEKRSSENGEGDEDTVTQEGKEES